MGINNLNVKFVIQKNILLLFNLMIQRMERVGRKSGDSTFVFFIPKWSRNEDPEEIKKRYLKKSKNLSIPAAKTGNTQLS